MRSHHIIFQFWLSYVAGMVCLGWILSYLDNYRWMGIAGLFLFLTCTAIFGKSFSRIDPEKKRELKADLTFAPFLILLALIILAGTIYPTAVLDSLSYRIPRILMWLQEGRVHFIDNPDARLNFMTPVWEFASTPIYQASGFRFLWLGSAVSWCLLYLSMNVLIKSLGADPKTSRWLSIIPASSVGFVLQAASTMNDIWSAALVSISLAFNVSFEMDSERNFRNIVCSGLALALAAGAKPHFAILALPWIIWFFFSNSRPLAAVSWKWVPAAALLAILCSPIPTFISNHLHYGNWTGPAGDGSFGLGSPWQNLLFGGVMFLWSVFQPSVNPWAQRMGDFADSVITGAAGNVPNRFQLISQQVAVVDTASIGLIVASVVIIGIIIALRSSSTSPKWAKLSAITGIACILIAISQVVPGTLGRSFIGFLVLLIPLGLVGFLRLDRRWIVALSSLSVTTGILALALSPGHPLWPAHTLAKWNPKLSEFLKPYLAFQERGRAGISLCHKIPPDAGEIAVLANGDQNLIHLWGAGTPKHHVRFFPRDVTLDDLASQGPEFIILAGAVDGTYLDLPAEIENDPRFSVIATELYQTRNDRGPETWLLIQKKENF